MKKSIFTLLFALPVFFISAQTAAYKTLNQLVSKEFPSVDLSEKLMAVNIWRVSDMNTRTLNKSFIKAGETYQVAKLKGGKKGLVVIAVNADDLSAEATIVISRDGVDQLLHLKLSDVPELQSAGLSNVVYDSAGNEVYRNLESETVFQKINQLITR